MGSYVSMGTPEPAAAHSASIRGMDRLLELQELDLSVDRLRSRLEELESEDELRAAQARLAEVEGRLGRLQLTIDESATAQRRLESDIDSIGLKMEDERKRLYDGSVANVRELQSIEAEVASLGARKSRMEDQLLERMEEREELDERLRPLEAEAAETREREAEIEEGSARELVEVERSLEERAAERAAMLPGVDEELLLLYEDMRRQKKGIGAVALVDGVCMGCHQKLSPVYLDRLKRETGVRRCEYCRRILVSA
jgi:predicted  nucleic acid-binding Zn-ribbon protein